MDVGTRGKFLGDAGKFWGTCGGTCGNFFRGNAGIFLGDIRENLEKSSGRRLHDDKKVLHDVITYGVTDCVRAHTGGRAGEGTGDAVFHTVFRRVTRRSSLCFSSAVCFVSAVCEMHPST